MDKYLVTKIEQNNGPRLIVRGCLADNLTKQYKEALICLIDEDVYDEIPDNLEENVMFTKIFNL